MGAFAENAFGSDDEEDSMDGEPDDSLMNLDEFQAPPPDAWRSAIYQEASVFLSQLFADPESKSAMEGIDQINNRIIAHNVEIGIPEEDHKLM